MLMHEKILELIPEGEKTFDLGEVKCRYDGKTTYLVPTNKRLMTCSTRLFGFVKDFDDFPWAKFDHVKISKVFGSISLELRLRSNKKTLKFERLNREHFDAFYRRIRERIAIYDEKYKISSKICPSCHEIIKSRAKMCPNCRYEFSPEIAGH